MDRESDITKQWRRTAPFWEKYQDVIRTMFLPVSEALIQDAEIVQGNSVLDVATGPGEPALTVAKRVGPKGRVTGVDPAPEMIEAAKRAAVRQNVGNAQFEVAFGDRLSFPADDFDAAVSRFGVMFFPSPVDGLREILRVLKPRRKLAMAVWHFLERNPFHTVLSRVVEKYVPSEPPEPDAPDAFRFATPGKLRRILDEAGAAESAERLLQFNIEAPVSLDEFWTLRSEMSDNLRTKLAGLSESQFDDVRSEVIAGLRQYSTNRGLSFPAEVLIISGRK